MTQDFGSDYISISDDQGNEYELEHLDTIEVNGVYYLAFLPADMDEDDDDYGMVILKQEGPEEDGYLVRLDEDEEEEIYQKFMERLFDDEEE